MTKRLGYFEQQGLDVDVVTEPAGVNAEDELIAGAVQGVVGFYDHTIDLQSKGTDVESLVQFASAPGEVELVSSARAADIKSPADFKGQSIGVTGLGSSTDFLTRYLTQKFGLQRDDYRLLPVDAGKTFIDAMRHRRIVAGMTTDPTASELLSSDQAKVLIDLRTEASTREALGGIYPAGCLYMRAAWVDAHPDEARKLTHAFVKTLRYIHTHSAEQIVDQLPRSYYEKRKALYVAAFKAFQPTFSVDGRMPDSGPRTVLAILSAIDPSVQATDVDLSKTYTTAFLDTPGGK
ncbi:ABC transporter substrate-binding protein [Trinickia dinghuensis]|uniref:ABC transporter substrate-binding protein n=1 Tax=Trinickia dinghuensis TaxID=2291023 RepID=UPI003CCC6D29